MKLPNGYGGVVKLSGKRRKPYLVRKTAGWHYDAVKDRHVQDFLIIGYAATKKEGLQMLADYNNNTFDITAAKPPSTRYTKSAHKANSLPYPNRMSRATKPLTSCAPLFTTRFSRICA